MEDPCKSGVGVPLHLLQILGFAVDRRGLGREIEFLANSDVADDGPLTGSFRSCREAAARATAQMPKIPVATLTAGHAARGQPAEPFRSR
jgi:hypothetical protein